MDLPHGITLQPSSRRLRPETHLSISITTNPNRCAPRVADALEVRGLCGTQDDAPTRVRLHRQLPADRVPDILGDDRHARLNIGAHRSVTAEAPEQSIELQLQNSFTTVGLTPLRVSFLIAALCSSHVDSGAIGAASSPRVVLPQSVRD